MAVLRVGRVADMFRLQLPGQTYTFICTLSQLREITCFIFMNLMTNVKHLLSLRIFLLTIGTT